MEYKLTKFPNSEVEIDVTIPFAEFEPDTKKAATLISENTTIEGFRNGKAPYEIIKNRLGELMIYEKAAGLTIKKVWPELLARITSEWKDKEFIPLGEPEITITKLAPGNELQFKVRLAHLPVITLPDYKKIAHDVYEKKNEVTVSDEEVQKTLVWIQESRAVPELVLRPAQSGDNVEIDFEVRHGGVKIENGDSRSHPLIIGKGKFLPGFEDHLLGMSQGEEKKFSLQAPEDWHNKSFAGKSLDFTVKMNEVKERKMAELSDEFARNLGNFPTLDDLKKNIKEGVLSEKADKEKQRVRTLMIEHIVNKTENEVPEVLIKSELKKMFEELRTNIESMGMKWEDYLLHIKKTPEELAKDWQKDAEQRVRAALVLREIGQRENVSVSEEEVEKRANQFLQQYSSAEEAEKSIDAEVLREYTRGILKNEKVFELLEKQ